MMTLIEKPARNLFLCLFSAMLLAGCIETGDRSVSTEHVLRVHDVAALNIDELDMKLNDLLSSEDLPLTGQVELMDEHRLAVNGSEHLQNQIERILAELAGDAEPARESEDREMQFRFWSLTLSGEDSQAPIPAELEQIRETLLAEFPGLKLTVADFGEFFIWPGSRGHFRSRAYTNVHVRALETTEQGVRTQADFQFGHSLSSNRFEINRQLRPGEPLVLARTLVEGGSDPSYQILVARMDWVD